MDVMNRTSLLRSITVMALLSACDAGYDAVKLADAPKDDEPLECWTPQAAPEAAPESEKSSRTASEPVARGEPKDAGEDNGADASDAVDGSQMIESAAGSTSFPTPPVLLEVTAFTIQNAQGMLPLRHGDTAVGTAIYRNPTDQPFLVKSILIKGRPQFEGAVFYDFTPVAEATIAPQGSITVEASRIMLPTDPIGQWLFHTNWQSADQQWHDGGVLAAEVASACACEAGQACCNEKCSDLRSDPQNCGACGNVCPISDPACCDGTCQSLLDDRTCGACDVDCRWMSDLCTCATNPATGEIGCYRTLGRAERCLR